MNRLALIALCLALPAGCALRPASETDPWFVIPPGSRLVLHRDLPLATGWARAFVQFGRPSLPGDIDEFHPYCQFVQRALARPGAGRDVIAADEFVTGAVSRRLVSAPGARQLASLGRLFGLERGGSNHTLTTEVRLHSEAQPGVRKLMCGFWGDPALERHLSVAQIRAALGDLVSLRLAP